MMILIYVALCMFRELERENREKIWLRSTQRLDSPTVTSSGSFFLRMFAVFPLTDLTRFPSPPFLF